MPKKTQLIAGTCTQLLHSPKGGIEGVLLEAKKQIVQVSLPPEVGALLAAKPVVGKMLRFLATADHSPKTAAAMHPVFGFESLADAKGNAVETPASQKGTTLKGAVASLHFAKHGEPNGVILGTGEFIHLKPHGMEQIAPEVGGRIVAFGELRMTILGTRMLEAHRVNGVDL